MFYSVHLYGADVQLLHWKTDSFSEAKNGLIELMEDVQYDEDQDDVKLYQMTSKGIKFSEGIVVFDYRYDYLNNEKKGVTK